MALKRLRTLARVAEPQPLTMGTPSARHQRARGRSKPFTMATAFSSRAPSSAQAPAASQLLSHSGSRSWSRSWLAPRGPSSKDSCCSTSSSAAGALSSSAGRSRCPFASQGQRARSSAHIVRAKEEGASDGHQRRDQSMDDYVEVKVDSVRVSQGNSIVYLRILDGQNLVLQVHIGAWRASGWMARCRRRWGLRGCLGAPRASAARTSSRRKAEHPRTRPGLLEPCASALQQTRRIRTVRGAVGPSAAPARAPPHPAAARGCRRSGRAPRFLP